MEAIYKVVVKGKLSGQDMMNRLHFRKEFADATDKAVLAQHVGERILGQWRFVAVQAMRWNTIEVYKLGDQNDAPMVLPVAVDGFGLNGDNCFLPLAAVLRIRTFVGGKTGRGRIYLPAQPSHQCNNGTWSPFWISQLQSVAGSHMQWFGPDNPQSGFNLGLGKVVDGAPEFKVVREIVAREYPGTQVRRNFLRGR